MVRFSKALHISLTSVPKWEIVLEKQRHSSKYWWCVHKQSQYQTCYDTYLEGRSFGRESCRDISSCRKSIGNLRNAWAKAQVYHQTHKPGFSKQLDLPPLCRTLYAQGGEQPAVSHIGWEEAPNHKTNPNFLQGYFASILSLICTSPDFSSKFSHHVVPHLRGHSLHQPTRRISWLPATRKMSKIRQLSLQDPTQVIYRVPFYHFPVREELALGRPRSGAAVLPSFPEVLGWRCAISEGLPPGPPCFTTDPEASQSPLGE